MSTSTINLFEEMALSKWSKLLQKYLFYYKDGFFELPYLSNSPKLMVDSFIKNPVNKHNPLVKSISSNNPFCKVMIRYRELEEGFWVLAYDIDIKQNIIAKTIYDENLESDYYFLTFSAFDYEFTLKDNSSKKEILLSTCWTFYKPKTNVSSYFYEGTSGKFYNIVFNKKWAEKNLAIDTIPNANELQNFLNLKTGFLTWLDIVPDAHRISKEISSILTLEKDGVFNTRKLRNSIFELVTSFFKTALKETRIQKYSSLGNLDYANASRAEKMILHNLSVAFIGIDVIAANVNMSPTKLKVIFKSVFGVSMLQYHKEKNLLLAEQLVKNSDVQIKNIAITTGFESASKFSASFKKRFGILPSELRNS